ncbi:hypothetical protein JRX38_01100 [Gluconobacter cerinus]|uniref:hypothetical protein n=1 Tax=Gluconobacter cerinus TaxID=38307 RepID=UPI00193F0D6E|nr:hypothetical protein [Gluconobacter cerinus]MBM3096632.1 hypothetical protein [Gluconobacter cerinus]
MTQNTEQNVQTRRDQLSTYPESVSVGRYSGDAWQLELDADDFDPDLLVEGPVLYVRCDIAHQSQKEDEARGAEEQRRKDAEIAGYRSTIDLLLQAIEAPQPIDAHLDPSVPDPVDYAREMTKRRKSLERMIADLREAKKQAFNQGYLIACCNLTNLHDEPSVACDVLAECGLTERDIEIADLTEYDAKALVKIRSARGGRDPIRAVLTREGGV